MFDWVLNTPISFHRYAAKQAGKKSVFGVFLVRIFSHSDLIRRDIFPQSDLIRKNTLYLSVFRLNAGKYGAEKLVMRTLFTQ